MELVYVGIGGNIGETIEVFQQVVDRLQQHENIVNVEVSNIYETTPVSDIPQNKYLNAVCRFQTSLDIPSLFSFIQEVEKELGKVEKRKNEPRVIDLDILFYGTDKYCKDNFEVPHPKWKERLFVLVPLLDLTGYVFLPDEEGGAHPQVVGLRELLKKFKNVNREIVRVKEYAWSSS